MRIINGSALEELKKLPEKSVNMCMTSPPYWALRDYGVEGQLGLEPTFDQYINNLCDIFDEVKRVLRDDGTCWVNIGDTYFGGGNNRGNNSPISDKQASNKGAIGQVQMNWKKTRDDCKQLDIRFRERDKYCCECGKKFNAMPGQYFCGPECSGVDNTKRELKGKLQNKSLIGIPMRFAIEMINRGWILRNTIIWHKPNAMPHSVKDRFTVDFEYLYFFSKKKKYYFKQQLEPFKSKPTKLRDKRNEDYGAAYLSPLGKGMRNGYEVGARNKRTTWTINTRPCKEAHFAVYSETLCETPIDAGCPEGGVVLDPFFGAGTTGLVAKKQNKDFIGIELNPDYIKIAERRIYG